MKRFFLTLFVVSLITAAGALITSCNVTRTVTTSSSYVQRGDTTVLIQSKTIESYDASRSADWRLWWRLASWGAQSPPLSPSQTLRWFALGAPLGVCSEKWTKRAACAAFFVKRFANVGFFCIFEDTDAVFNRPTSKLMQGNLGHYSGVHEEKLKLRFSFLVTPFPSLCEHKRQCCH